MASPGLRTMASSLQTRSGIWVLEEKCLMIWSSFQWAVRVRISVQTALEHLKIAEKNTTIVAIFKKSRD